VPHRVFVGSGATIRFEYCEDVNHLPEGATRGYRPGPAAARRAAPGALQVRTGQIRPAQVRPSEIGTPKIGLR
jgi:hypothetical protein